MLRWRRVLLTHLSSILFTSISLYFLVFFLYFPFPIQFIPSICFSSFTIHTPAINNVFLPSFGIDRLTILFLLLTTFLMPIVVLVLQSFSTFSSILLFAIELLLLLCQLSLSLLIFFLFFELIVLSTTGLVY